MLRILAIACLAFWIATPAARAAGNEAEQRFLAVLEAARREHKLPGVSVAIATRQGVIWTGAVGYADLGTHARANEAYLYGMGSITKTFIACLVERLIDQGRLAPDDTAQGILGPEVLSGIPNAQQATIRELLEHSSGIPTWEFDEEWIRRGRGAESSPERHWGKQETLDYLRSGRHPATNPPGHGYAYSNTNFTILGLVLEKITGRDVVDLLHDELLAPLGLMDIHLEGFEPIDTLRMPARYHYDTAEFRASAGLSPAFRVLGNGLLDVSRSNLSTEWTAGGLVSTARDLVAFTVALRDGRVVPASTLERMTGFHPTDEADEQVGQGLFREQVAGDWLIGYDGGVLGFGAVMGWFEQGDVAIALMTNVGMMHTGDASWYPLKLVRSREFVRAVRQLAASLSPAKPAGPLSLQ